MNVRPWQAAKPCNCTTDRDLSPAEQARIDAIEAAPPAPESFDATAALRRVKALAEDYAVLGATLHNVPKAETFAEVAGDLLAVILTPATHGHPDSPRDASTTATEGWRAPATSTLTGQDQS